MLGRGRDRLRGLSNSAQLGPIVTFYIWKAPRIFFSYIVQKGPKLEMLLPQLPDY